MLYAHLWIHCKYIETQSIFPDYYSKLEENNWNTKNVFIEEKLKRYSIKTDDITDSMSV